MTDFSGQYLGRYYLTERLGEGGMAVVYKAYDTRLERDVAIKIIRKAAFPAEELEQVLKRFEREAKSLAKLSHSNIVKVHDFGEHEGSPYLVMEYLPGGTLKNIVGNPVPWQDAMRLILPVARGMAYAHQRGVLHRDIKPANVLLTDGGEPMLSDFGIARLFEGGQTTTLTESGTAIGTPEYMAPEQWTGTTSPQSDLYSLGIVLYELITGRKPYVADTPAAILIMQATEPLPSPRKFVSDLPEVLENILIKTLAKEPGDRYKDVNAFIVALERLYVHASVIPPVTQRDIEGTNKVTSRKPEVSIPTRLPKREDGGMVKVAEVSKSQQADEPLPVLTSVAREMEGDGTIPGSVKGKWAKEPKSQTAVIGYGFWTTWIFTTMLAGAFGGVVVAFHCMWSDGRLADFFDPVMLPRLRSNTCLQEGPVFGTIIGTLNGILGWVYLWFIEAYRKKPIAKWHAWRTFVPSLALLFFFGLIIVIFIGIGVDFSEGVFWGPIFGLIFSTISQWILLEKTIKGARVLLWMLPIALFLIIAIWLLYPQPYNPPAAPPTTDPWMGMDDDGDGFTNGQELDYGLDTQTPLGGGTGWLAYQTGSDDQYFIFKTLIGGGSSGRVYVNENNAFYPRYSPDGQKIAFLSPIPELKVHITDGSNVTLISSRESNNQRPAWSPDSQWIMDAGLEGLYIINIDDGNIETIDTEVQVFEPVWSPDGQWIAFEHPTDNGNRGVYKMAIDGSNLILLPTPQGLNLTPDWSPDGKLITFANGPDWSLTDIYVMDSEGGNLTRLTQDSRGEHEPVWSPDGEWIAFSRDGEIYVMKADGSLELKVTNRTSDDYHSYPSWEPSQ